MYFFRTVGKQQNVINKKENMVFLGEFLLLLFAGRMEFSLISWKHIRACRMFVFIMTIILSPVTISFASIFSQSYSGVCGWLKPILAMMGLRLGTAKTTANRHLQK